MSVHVLSHPLARVLLTQLRDTYTQPSAFRQHVHDLSLLLAVEATRELKTELRRVKTPLEETQGESIYELTALVPIMRAGSGMLPAFQIFLPDSLVYHVQMSRDHETFEPNFHGSSIPSVLPDDLTCFILDPMLATGGSARLALQQLKMAGARRIAFVGILGAPEGVSSLERNHPDVQVFLGGLDRQLNKRTYILQGLGDAGDRQFPTR